MYTRPGDQNAPVQGHSCQSRSTVSIHVTFFMFFFFFLFACISLQCFFFFGYHFWNFKSLNSNLYTFLFIIKNSKQWLHEIILYERNVNILKQSIPCYNNCKSIHIFSSIIGTKRMEYLQFTMLMNPFLCGSNSIFN